MKKTITIAAVLILLLNTCTSQAIKEPFNKRFKNVMANICFRTTYKFMARKLMNKKSLIKYISDEEFIYAVCSNRHHKKREDNLMFMKELSKRNAIPNKLLTDFYNDRLLKREVNNVYYELMIYWDNELLNGIFKSNLSFYSAARILELNSDDWSINKSNRDSVFVYLKKIMNFNEHMEINEESIKLWSEQMKIIAISRSDKIIHYLMPFLENKNKFEIEDWSRYNMVSAIPMNAKPDVISVRVCDIAFVAMLKALDQISLKMDDENWSQLLVFKNDVLSEEFIKMNQLQNLGKGFRMELYEKQIKIDDRFYVFLKTIMPRLLIGQ